MRRTNKILFLIVLTTLLFFAYQARAENFLDPIILKKIGLGISEKDYQKFKVKAPARLAGRVLLRVQAKGEAYYVNPTDLKLKFLEPPAAPAVSYNDVAVIINNNSSSSKEIGEYFAKKRAIPNLNIIRVTATTSEEIDGKEFGKLQKQVEDYLVTSKLQDKINYLVTTKGVPLRVNIGNLPWPSNMMSSVESELALILGKYQKSINLAGPISHPYYQAKEKFSHSKYDIYLVTRLDAYNVKQVKDLIDRAGQVNKITTSSQFILDDDPGRNNGSYGSLSSDLDSAAKILQAKKYKVILDKTDVYLTKQKNVLGYISWGSNDAHAKDYVENAQPKNIWLPGAIAETFVSTSARSFNYPPTYGQSLVADLIVEGLTGIKGYVYEPFASAMAHPDILFDKYTGGYNLAESFSAASKNLSWMDVIIGDPKAKLVK